MKKLFLSFLLVYFSCHIVHAQTKTSNRKAGNVKTSARKPVIKYGTASFYAKKFNGRKTASGEIYYSTKYTAACNVLPLKTWIKVTNLRNKKTIIVKINDRLHPKNKRLVDLSKIAAQKLGYIGRGLTRVKIEVLNNFQLSVN